MTRAVEVQDLRVTYPTSPPVFALDGVSLHVDPGECLGILGESGSGKSTLARALLGLTTDAASEGSIRIGGEEVHHLDENGWRGVRWQRIALVFQSTTALNPVLRVGAQVAEPLEVHRDMPADRARRRAGELLARVGLPATAADRYPTELSGGQRRLCLIAMALACEPDVLVLDEPTAGLDPLTRRHVLDLLDDIRATSGAAMLFMTHDVDSLRKVADRVAVLYRGWRAEDGPARAVLDDPRHPYTWGLLNAHPGLGSVKDLRGIRGNPPDPTVRAVGCPFADRCTQAVDVCREDERPPLVTLGEGSAGREVACVRGGLVSVVSARGLVKSYETRSGLVSRTTIPAVRGIDVEVREGEVVALVGPNGAGKSTLGRMLLRLIEPDGGTVELEGTDLLALRGGELKAMRRRAQMLFQDPYDALSPRMTVAECVREPLDIQQIGTPDERDQTVRDTLSEVRLPPSSGFLDRFTHELSGGQLQRVALARALVLEPKLLVADEPFEGLDPSEQAKMLQLLKALQVERGMAMVLVSHDLAVVVRVADRVVVLDQGLVVEEATSTHLLTAPQHPLTKRMLAAAGRVEAAPAMNGDHVLLDLVPSASAVSEGLPSAGPGPQ